MKVTALTILFIMTVVIFIVLIYGFYVELKERQLPKWKRVQYFLLREFVQDEFIHSQKDLIDLKSTLIYRYRLTPQQADDCIENLYDPKWFELNIT